ncbi:MAG: rod shape-determining protein RodA [Candidatus Aminicenantales bacterium]
MIDRRQIVNIDWVLITLLLLNSFLGVLIIYSGSHYLPGNYYLRQIIWILISFVGLVFFTSIDYKFLVAFSFYFYLIFIFLLGWILFFGKMVGGAKSWIDLYFIQFQPSELIKIVLILVLAAVFAEYRRPFLGWGKFFLSSFLVVLPAFLVCLQPDLGTALSYLPILAASLILAGINKKILIFLLIFTLLWGGIGWNLILKDYQKERLKVLLSPSHDPLGAGYHIQQSKIAVGSGGFMGKGYKKGSQSQLRFLPARHTDFVFSVIGEEFGFLGVVAALLSYFLLLSRIFLSIKTSRDRMGVYLVFMVGMMIACQFFINVLMIIGLFPITGIPLPLLSYGGSSLLTTYLGISLVLNVKMRRFANV